MAMVKEEDALDLLRREIGDAFGVTVHREPGIIALELSCPVCFRSERGERANILSYPDTWHDPEPLRRSARKHRCKGHGGGAPS